VRSNALKHASESKQSHHSVSFLEKARKVNKKAATHSKQNLMTTEKDEYLARLAQQCGRYEDMTNYSEELMNIKGSNITAEERNLLSFAYKQSVDSLRTAMRAIRSYELREKRKDNSPFLAYIQEYGKKVQNELFQLCQHVISFLDNILQKVTDAESRVFFLKMKGDYNRYVADNSVSTVRDQAVSNAQEAYRSASGIELSALNPVRLNLALSIATFEYEVLNDVEKAIQTVQEALEAVDNQGGVDESEDYQPEVVNAINTLREILEVYKSEAELANQ